MVLLCEEKYLSLKSETSMLFRLMVFHTLSQPCTSVYNTHQNRSELNSSNDTPTHARLTLKSTVPLPCAPNVRQWSVFHKKIYEFTTSNDTQSLGTHVACNVMHRSSQCIFLLRDSFSSYTINTLIPDEQKSIIKATLIGTTAELKAPEVVRYASMVHLCSCHS